MLYSTVSICPSPDSKSWYVVFSDLEGEREESEGTVSALGFYHYPRTVGKKEAFQILKDKMMQRHMERIQELQQSLAELERLEVNEGES